MNTLRTLLSVLFLRAEIIGGIFLILIVLIIFVPVPPWLIDLLITLNICISALLLMAALYLRDSLQLSSFPSILLITTIFRMGISISTTRQILLQQNAGHIVEALGNYVVGGSLAVGAIVFLILTVVNFIVITRGAERVAEVAARFSLDAMPGKQLSIDSDLRANLITSEQAKQMRYNLAKESKLYGAMDGAMKFVKGDAIAGIIIVIVNIVGGLFVGIVQHNMDMAGALQLYSILTIGDGLIAQIPALLISLTAGIIITRVPDEENKKFLSTDIFQQVLMQPQALITAATFMLCFAFIPGMPSLLFVAFSASTFTLGAFNIMKSKRIPAPVVTEIAPQDNAFEDIKAFNATVPYLITFAALQQNNESVVQLIGELRKMRNTIVDQYGYMLPVFEIRFTGNDQPDCFRFCVNEIPVLTLPFSADLVVVAKDDLPDTVRQTLIAAENHYPEDDEKAWLTREVIMQQAPGIVSVPAQTYIVRATEQTLFETCSQFIGLHETSALVKWLEFESPELAQELQRSVPLNIITAILHRLVNERVSLRSVRLIVESIIMHGSDEYNVDKIAAMVRLCLKNIICHQYAVSGVISAYVFSQQSEALLHEYLAEADDVVSRTRSEQLYNASAIIFKRFTEHHLMSDYYENKTVLLVEHSLRSPLCSLLSQNKYFIPVISYSEIPQSISIKIIDHIIL